MTLRIKRICAITTLAALGASVAQAAESEEYRFNVAEFQISGESPLNKKRANALLKEYTSKPVNVAELRKAAEELEHALAKDGYNFHRVRLPAQKLKDGQSIKIEVDRLSIGQVTTSGNRYFSDENILASMPLLKVGDTPNSIAVSNALALAKDNPAKDVHVVFVRGEFPGTVDAKLSVTDQYPHDLMLWANNSGSDLTSRSRAGIQYSHRNLWGRDHDVSLSYSLSPEDTDDLTQYGLNYTVPIYAIRSKANIFYSSSEADTGVVADVFDVSGSGETIGASITRLLSKIGKFQHQVGFGLTDKLFDSDVTFEDEDIGADVRSRPISVFYDWNTRKSQWAATGNVSWYHNLSGGGLNDDASYEFAKPGAAQDWQRWNAAVDLSYVFSDVWSLAARARIQISDDRLISGEQFGMGGVLGSSGPRGFLEREVATDTGQAGSVELWRRFPIKKLDIGLFVDAASGSNNRPFETEVKRQSLSSAGASVRWNPKPSIRIDFDYGYVLDGIEGSDGGGTQDRDSRLHLSVRFTPSIGGKR